MIYREKRDSDRERDRDREKRERGDESKGPVENTKVTDDNPIKHSTKYQRKDSR